MCGIAGIAAFRGAPSPTLGQLSAMCQTIVHRGPDDEGLDVRAGVALGMRRLAIIDLDGGRQPIFNEDRTVRTVFNGEIYNFRELRRELESQGHIFSTNSDTEVLVHGYEQYGSTLPAMLNGMFAFAVHDSARNRLLLARDHLGIKPLYYAVGEDYLVWGSELKTVLASGLVDRSLHLRALEEFLTWEYVPAPRTLLRAVKKLEPGNSLTIDLAAPRCDPECYWDIPLATPRPGFTREQWMEEVKCKVKQCVQRQLISDVPLGAFLSGGVDSSLVVSSMGEAETFSIGFADRTYNELAYARRVASHLGVRHRYEIIQPGMMDLFDHLMYFMDDPIGDFSIFPTFLVSQIARKNVTVALSGDGGDELFGGYETYVADRFAGFYRHLPATIHRHLVAPIAGQFRPRSAKKGLINKFKRFIEGMNQPSDWAHARWRAFLSSYQSRQLFADGALGTDAPDVGSHIVALRQRAGDRNSLDRNLYVDVKSYLSDNCLVKVDRMSMAVSLETRVPLLDKELVELAFCVPSSFKIHRGESKWLLKKIAATVVPPDCVYRPKEGFSIPIKHWLTGQFRPLMEDLLSESVLRPQGLFRPDFVHKLMHEHLSGRANNSHVLWSLMVFQAWRARWLDG